MLRMIVRLIALMALMLSAVAVSAQKDAPTAASDVVGVKAILLNGDTINGVFEAGGTAHLYGFNASQGDVVTISMTQAADSTLDPFLVLLGPNGEVIASDDDSGTEQIFSSLISNVTLPESGSYFVMATSFIYIDNILVETGDATATQQPNESYTLTINGITPPANLDGFDPEAISFTAVPVAPGDSVQGESTAEYPVGYYVLQGTAGQRVTITALGNDGFDTILHVFGPEGDRIAVNDDDDTLGNLSSAVRDLELPEDGLYLIWATNVFFYNAGKPDEALSYDGGTYTLNVQ